MTPCPICGGSGKHYPPCSDVPTDRREMMGDDATPGQTAAIVAWLRRPDAQNWIINLTCAARNNDVRNAMSKCADIIEARLMDAPIHANGSYIQGDQS